MSAWTCRGSARKQQSAIAAPLGPDAAASLTVYCSDAARFGCGRPSEPTWTAGVRILADQQSLLTLIARLHVGGCGFQPQSRRGCVRQGCQAARLAQAVWRHVAVNRFVLPGLHQIGLVPDPGAVASSDSPPILAPGVHVRIVLIPGERLEMIICAGRPQLGRSSGMVAGASICSWTEYMSVTPVGCGCGMAFVG